jgi:hypothetical protein
VGQTRYRFGYLKNKVEKCKPKLTCCLRPEHNEPPHNQHGQKLAEAMYPIHPATKVIVIHINIQYTKSKPQLLQNTYMGDKNFLYFRH